MKESIIRTVVPVLVGVLIAYAAKVGMELPEGPVTEIVTVGVAWAYYTAVRLLEEYVHPLFGRVLLAAGVTGKKPRYDLAA